MALRFMLDCHIFGHLGIGAHKDGSVQVTLIGRPKGECYALPIASTMGELPISGRKWVGPIIIATGTFLGFRRGGSQCFCLFQDAGFPGFLMSFSVCLFSSVFYCLFFSFFLYLFIFSFILFIFNFVFFLKTSWLFFGIH